MNRILLWLIIAGAIAIGFEFYRSQSGTHLNVTPDAERQIEKAKHR